MDSSSCSGVMAGSVGRLVPAGRSGDAEHAEAGTSEPPSLVSAPSSDDGSGMLNGAEEEWRVSLSQQ